MLIINIKNADTRVYVAPVSEMICLGADCLICESETELVSETEGEW